MVSTNKFTILIPTRNRPLKVTKLLLSICQSEIKPHQVVVVASGDDIYQVVSSFETKLPIKYIYSERPGQIAQKKIGIDSVISEIEWILFLDDDVLLSQSAISTAFKTLQLLEMTEQEKVLGIGLAIESTSRTNNSSKLAKVFGKFFYLYDQKPGVVLRSGQTTSYLDSSKPIYTEWLNGISMWRFSACREYLKVEINSKYAACEDLIFSYPQSRKGNLLFSPTSHVHFQDLEYTDFENSSVMETAAFNRMFFVMQNKDFSKWLCLWSQLGRSLFAVFAKRFSPGTIISNSFLLIKLFVVCLRPNLLRRFLSSTEGEKLL